MFGAAMIFPDETPDAEYPMILATGRQLEHWHTGSMMHRSKVLDALEPEANCSIGYAAGDMLRVTARRGAIEIMARSDRAIA